MVTVNLAKKSNSREEMAKDYGYVGMSELCRGRMPFAYAEINAHDDELTGRASFYYTPLGLVVCLAVRGLNEKVSVYPLSFVSKDGAVWKLPPLYNKGGYAWCSALTGKISVCEILGGEIRIGDNQNGHKAVSGSIICPLVCEIS